MDGVGRAPCQVLPGGGGVGEVDGHLGAGLGEGVGTPGDAQAGAGDAELLERTSFAGRVDGGDQVHPVGAEDGVADGGPHATGGAEHSDLDHSTMSSSGGSKRKKAVR
jgi:hypothetical protein